MSFALGLLSDSYRLKAVVQEGHPVAKSVC